MPLQIPGLTVVPSEKMPNDRIRVLLHGPSGAGKSTLASTIAELGPTLYVDLVGEKGGRSFKNAPYEKNIEVVRPDSVVQMRQIYQALAKGDTGYQAVVIDSLSAFQKSAYRFVLGYEEDAVAELRKGRPGADQRAWGNILEIMTDLCVFWYSLADGDSSAPMHVIMTSQSKSITDDEGNGRFFPDVSQGSRSVAMSTPDYVFYCDIAELPDDRTGEMTMKHVVRRGPDNKYATKARIPVDLRDKVPAVMGTNEPLSLAKFAKLVKAV